MLVCEVHRADCTYIYEGILMMNFMTQYIYPLYILELRSLSPLRKGGSTSTLSRATTLSAGEAFGGDIHGECVCDGIALAIAATEERREDTFIDEAKSAEEGFIKNYGVEPELKMFISYKWLFLVFS